jgi:hypothetical protein
VLDESEEQLSAYPNPFEREVEFDFPNNASAESWTLTIFDVAGRMVRTWSGSNATGRRIWDGIDLSGARAPAGIYFVRFKSGAHEASSKVIMLR